MGGSLNHTESALRSLALALCAALVLIAAGFAAPPPATPPKTYLSEVREVIESIRPTPDSSGIDSFLKRVPTISKTAPLEDQVAGLRKYMFESLSLRADTSYLSRNKKDNVLPDSVLETKQGHCLGLTTLFLLAAEKLQLESYFVRGPDHVFPRLCSAGRCVNVEMLKKGKILPDSYYIENLVIPKLALEKKIYLSSIAEPSELAASLYLGVGFVAGSKQPEVAEVLYRKAIEKSPGFADAYSNLASVEAQLGSNSEVPKLLEKALGLNPTHYAAALNMGVLMHNQKKLEEAVRFYTRAIESNPLSTQAYRRRSRAYEDQGNSKAALGDLERILVVEPRFCDVLSERDALKRMLRIQVETDSTLRLKKLKAAGQCLALRL